VHRVRFVNDVPLNASNPDGRVHVIEYWEMGQDTVQHFSWVTDLRAHKRHVFLRMRGGRARWKIENETFNQVAALQSALAARLLAVQGHHASLPAEDRLITVTEAAERLGTSQDWLYRNAYKLPFMVRIAPRQVRFSVKGIERYLHARQGLQR
jgi:predicted DNA-binding transcriptional regulator AlpA